MDEGIYRLTQDVENPTADRRKADWRCRPVWEKGSMVYLTWDSMDFDRPVLSMLVKAKAGALDQRTNRWHDVPSVNLRGHWDLIAPHLEPVELSFNRLVRLNHYRYGPSPKTLLRKLVDADLVSLEALIELSGEG